MASDSEFSDLRLGTLASFSLLILFNPATLGSDAVPVSCPGRWLIRLHSSGLLSTVTYYSPTRFQSSEMTQILEPDSWYQLGIVLDLGAGRLRSVFRQVGQPDWTTGEFRILSGTLGNDVRSSGRLCLGSNDGHELFGGGICNVTVYDHALATEEMRASLQRLLPPRQTPALTLDSTTFPMRQDPRVLLPVASDVCMSSRWWHPRGADDRNDTMRDLRAFHATRLEWIYDASPEHIRTVKSASLAFCTTINATDNEPGRPYSGRNFDGGLAFFSWMASWLHDGAPVGACCVNNERYHEHQRAEIETAVRAGAEGVQYDDWASNLSFAVNNGECFCDFCLRKFATVAHGDYREQLKKKGVPGLNAYLAYRQKNAADPLHRAYVQFQQDSVREHLRRLKEILASLTPAGGRRASLSINANFDSPSPRSKAMAAGDLPDYFVGEGGDESLAGMFVNAKVAEALGRQTIFSPFPYKRDVTRSEIALQYALGQLCLFPMTFGCTRATSPVSTASPKTSRICLPSCARMRRYSITPRQYRRSASRSIPPSPKTSGSGPWSMIWPSATSPSIYCFPDELRPGGGERSTPGN